MRSKRSFSWFRLFLAVILIYFSYVGIEQQFHINDVQREKEIASIRLAEARQINQELIEERDRLRQAGYIEKIAREELGLVKPGELPYISAN